MTKLIKYEPLLEIVTFQGKKYYTLEKNKSLLETDLSTKKFIPIQGCIVNVNSIEYIQPATNDINQVESKLIELSKEKADKIRTQVYLRKENNPHKTLNDVVLDNIIKSV